MTQTLINIIGALAHTPQGMVMLVLAGIGALWLLYFFARILQSCLIGDYFEVC